MNMKVTLLSVGAFCFLSQALSAQTDTTKVRNIDEVVVVAYGRQKKETVVGANTQIKADQIKNRAVTNIAQAVEGASAGVQISTGSGQPGSAPSIRIRGIGSITGSSAPLFIVDGVVNNTGIARLNPDDIESINILKDAASTSLYGSGAANGVVMITTKKGRSGRDVVNFSMSTGFSERFVPQYERVNAAQYYPIVWEALRNGYLSTNPKKSLADANAYASNNLIGVLKQNVYDVPDNELVIDGVLNPNARLKFNDFDWDKAIARTGFRQNYDFNYSGGTKSTHYYASLGYLKETGYVINSDIERFTGRLNVDSQLKDWVKVGVNIFTSNSFGNTALDGASNSNSIANPYYFSRRMGPIYSPYLYEANGQAILDANGQKQYDLNQVRGGNVYTGRHTIYENTANINYDKSYDMNSRVFAEFTLLPNLTLTTNAGYDTRNFRNKKYYNKVSGEKAPAGSASRMTSTTQAITWNQLLNYSKSFGDHDFDVLLGHESNKLIYEYQYGAKQGQVADDNDDLINFITPTDLTSYTDNYRKEGYFARLNYNFQEKYIVSGSYRRDASSRFSKDSRWSDYWSVGLGWLIHRENFMASSPFSELKLRGSYGEVGNDNVGGYYAYQSVFDLGFNNVNEPGIIFAKKADPTITWETNNQMDIALDFGLLKNRISGTVELYKRATDGLLFGVPQPVNAGIPGNKIDRNLGSMSNKGIEIQLNLVPIRTEDFKWDLFVNATKNVNEITKLPEGQEEIISSNKKLMVGSSIYDYWLRQWYGVDPANGDGLYLVSDEYRGSGDADVRTVNGAEVTTNFNKAKYDYSGSSIPDWFGSFGTSFRYKAFELSTLFTYQIGGKIYDTNYAQLMSGYPQGIALNTDILDRWQKPGDVTNVPRVDSNIFTQYNADSSRWLTDASYVNFRSATLGYNFNRDLVSPYGFTALKIYVNGENIWAKTSRKGLEPAESFNGSNTSRYSPARIVSLGINMTF